MSDTSHFTRVEVNLLGEFSLVVADGEVGIVGLRKVRELVAYLVINRGRSLPREVLADRLWPEAAGDARKTLRHVLWQFHDALDPEIATPVVVDDHGRLHIDPSVALEADVARLEQTFQTIRSSNPAAFSIDEITRLVRTIGAFGGELLEGSYSDWCVVERERYRAMYLELVETLMGCAADSGDSTTAISLGEDLLRRDGAAERTHRRLMVLRHGIGDRIGAMRQFQACEAALLNELDVIPAPETLRLYESIRDGVCPSAAQRDADAATELQLLDELSETIEQLNELVARARSLLVDHLR